MKVCKFFSAVLIAAVCSIAPAAAVRSARAETSRAIDVYLIAGQSNAVGHADIPADSTVFPSVLYAGQVQCGIDAAAGTNDYLETFTPVRGGLGGTPDEMGPEYGMAEALAPYYRDGRTAIFIKSAAGGVSLRNLDSDNSGRYGNYYPPSLRGAAAANRATGVQYDRLLNVFRTVFDKLIAQGYAPRLRGLAWMHGETDRRAPDEYAGILPVFLADLRADLGRIAQADLSAMPVVLGEISDTSTSYDDKLVNERFNAMLHDTAATVNETAVIDSGRFWVTDSNGDILGTDKWHWNGRAMRAVGRLFGEKLAEMNDLTASSEPDIPPADTQGGSEGTSGGCGSALAGALALSAAALVVFVRKP